MGPPSSAAPFVPDKPTYPKLRAAAAHCTGCPLYAHATQTVFGEGSVPAAMLLIGQIPGDQEDKAGHPFVGPAGQLLDRCLAQAGIARQDVYVTNAVKHFKWEPRGKRRLHRQPNGREIAACKPWLDAELEVLKPRVIVCLGATAAQALLGKTFRVSRERGTWHEVGEARVIATVHPSSLLRMPQNRDEAIAAFTADLKTAVQGLMQKPASGRRRAPVPAV